MCIFYYVLCRFMNDNALDKGIQEYIPQKIFITGGDESGEKATCQGDSGTMFSTQLHCCAIITEILYFLFFRISSCSHNSDIL